MKIIGKLQDGTVFFKKGHDEEELFEFRTDEGNMKFAIVLPRFSLGTLECQTEVKCFTWWTEQVIDGLDRAVVTMKKGEVALLTISPEYAFGSSESKQDLAVIPPNSTVYYEVELVSFVKVSSSFFRHSWFWLFIV